MTLVADVVDAVVGGDTHRDTHALEICAPSGARIASVEIDNDDAGFEQALQWIVEHAPGPRVVVGLEGTRSYGVGLTRAVQAAGLVVVEVERPKRAARRRGKCDPIDAHLAALYTLGLDGARLPTPRADGEREALRILLSARREMTSTRTRQINRLRALLLTGDDSDRQLARGTLSDTRLTAISRRRGTPLTLSTPRSGEPRHVGWPSLSGKPDTTSERTRSSWRDWSTRSPRPCRRSSESGRSARRRRSSRGPTPDGAATTLRSPRWQGPARCRPAAAESCGTGSTEAVTGA